MQGLDARLINPFLEACVGVIGMVAQTQLKVVGPKIANSMTQGHLAIKVGVVGELNGEVTFEISPDNAKDIASKMMCGMPVEALDEMACSALSELGNMVAGNAATIFSSMDILIDITTPRLIAELSAADATINKGLVVPLSYNEQEYMKVYINI
ncbi:MAG: chemotaxis protein CheX [Lachnospiraceae bacterium]|nr:chemotaxis protein CheX [Lachnospiraceae bacterium]